MESNAAAKSTQQITVDWWKLPGCLKVRLDPNILCLSGSHIGYGGYGHHGLLGNVAGEARRRLLAAYR